MADLNIRNVETVDPELLSRLHAEAARRIPGKGALRMFVIRALQKAVAPQIRPRRYKLCAHCFQVNQELAAAEKEAQKANPYAAYQAQGSGAETAQGPGNAAGGVVSPFAHLLDEIEPERKDAAASPGSSAATGADGPPLPAPVELPVKDLTSVCEVADGLWVGSDKTLASMKCIEMEAVEAGTSKWAVISAAKEPWHRAMVGYSEFKAPKDSPEYFYARRGNHLALNLIDLRKIGADGNLYVPQEVIDRAMEFIREQLTAGNSVLVHCNQGRSRGPSLAFLYMWKNSMADVYGEPLPSGLDEAMTVFRKLYPAFQPGAGLLAYLKGLA